MISHSSYYDSKNLSTILQTCTYKFIISMDIQSTNVKVDELRLFIEFLQTLNFMFSVICI